MQEHSNGMTKNDAKHIAIGPGMVFGILFRMTGIRLLSILLLLSDVSPVPAQIPFGDFIPPEHDPEGRYGLMVMPLPGYENLDFGQLVVGDGLREVALGSEDLAIVEIEGIRYLNVFVTFDAPSHMTLEGMPTSEEDKRMNLDVKGAYANEGTGNIGVSYRQPFSGNAAVFPIFRTKSGPPNPPPTPPHEGYLPPRESAYLFLYGSVTVGEVQHAGPYEAEITVTIDYDI